LDLREETLSLLIFLFEQRKPEPWVGLHVACLDFNFYIEWKVQPSMLRIPLFT